MYIATCKQGLRKQDLLHHTTYNSKEFPLSLLPRRMSYNRIKKKHFDDFIEISV